MSKIFEFELWNGVMFQVIARIFYCVNRSWSGRISIPELRRANLLQVIHLLEDEEDINQVTQYFR